jgi:aquaporin Z
VDASLEAKPDRWRAVLTTLARNWPEYLIEAWGLGLFMVSAGVFATLLEYPGSPVHQAIPDEGVRRALIGVAMGLTAIGIIYSPWGQRSGAHLNPAVTLTFWRLGKVGGVDAVFYILAQAIGGLLGVLIAIGLIGSSFADPPVHYAATMPGEAGRVAAFIAELVISGLLMFCVLTASSSIRLTRLTGLFAGILVATYITIEAPLSGMSMNPARSLASAVPGGLWDDLWIYFLAPPLGMLGAASLYLRWRGAASVDCAKLDHAPRQRCIHCGYVPSALSAALNHSGEVNAPQR